MTETSKQARALGLILPWRVAFLESCDDVLDEDTFGNDRIDPVKFESLNILADLIEQLRRPAIARVKE